MFGHCVSVYFADALDKHAEALNEIGANVNNGLADVLDKLDRLPTDKKAEIEADIAACYESGPALAMVDSRKGKTNLHVPNDVIVDASMPVVVRDGGKMWNKDDALQDTVAMLMSKVRTIAAYAHRHDLGHLIIYPHPEKSFCENLLHMMFTEPYAEYEPHPEEVRALGHRACIGLSN